MICISKQIYTTTIGALIVGLLLSGCGRRGALETPPGDRIVTTDKNGKTIEQPAPKPDRPFILDGLI